jgi:hypothetical protein
MGATSLTRTYNARLTALLDKIRPVLENNISTSNAFFFKVKKSGMWKTESKLGDKLRVPLMYGFAPVSMFAATGVGQVDVTPADGITAAFWDWARLGSSITIGDFEKAQNKDSVLPLLTSKTEQAMAGLEDFFGRSFLQGQGAVDTTSILTARTDGSNSFVDPIGKLIAKDPTVSSTIGEVNQSTESWWQNQQVSCTNTNFASQLKSLDHLINLCSKGAGGSPDLFVADLLGYEQIQAALRSFQRYVDYETVDFPFKAMRVNGAPFTFDQFVPDATTPSTTVASGAKSTVYACNTKFQGISVYSGANFTPGDFVRAPNGAGETALVQWYGASWVSRRDKLGVLHALDNSVTS